MGWRDRAACRGMDTELFFPTSTVVEVIEAATREALRVCARCPVRRDCAADRPAEACGVWGGVYHPEPWNRFKHRTRRPVEPAAITPVEALVAEISRIDSNRYRAKAGTA